MSRTQKVVRNVLVTLVTQIVVWGLAFVLNLFLPRYLNPQQYGLLMQANDFSNILTAYVPLGTSMLLTRETARFPNRVGEFLTATLFVRVLLAVTAFLIAILVLPRLNKPPVFTTLALLTLLGTIIYIISEAFNAALFGLDRMGRSSITGLLEKSLSTGAALMMIKLRSPLLTFGYLPLISASVALSANLAAFRRLLPSLRLPSRDTVRLMAIGGLPFFASGFFRTVYNSADSLILGQMDSDAAAGWYGVAVKPFSIVMMFAHIVCMAMLPTLTRLYSEDQTRFRFLLRRLLGIILLMAIIIGIPLLMIPERILFELLPYQRDKYAQSAPALMVYGIGILFWYATQALGTALIIANREKVVGKISFTAMLLTIGGCFLLIPFAQHQFNNAAVGATMADVIVEIYMAAAMWFYMPKDFYDGREMGLFLGKAFLSAVPLILLLHFVASGWMTWTALVIGALVYLFLAVALGCVSRQDIEVILQGVRKRGQDSEVSAETVSAESDLSK